MIIEILYTEEEKVRSRDMVLLDHCHPPLSMRRHWHAFHNAWATYISSDLNLRLPQGYLAEPNVQFGIEIDVAAFEESERTEVDSLDTPVQWEPPTPSQTLSFQPAGESVEISIFNSEAGPILAGAIELVSNCPRRFAVCVLGVLTISTNKLLPFSVCFIKD